MSSHGIAYNPPLPHRLQPHSQVTLYVHADLAYAVIAARSDDNPGWATMEVSLGDGSRVTTIDRFAIDAQSDQVDG